MAKSPKKSAGTDVQPHAQEPSRYPVREVAASTATSSWLVKAILHREGWDSFDLITIDEWSAARERALSAPINE